MKHSLQVTIILALLFFSAQIMGLVINQRYMPEPGIVMDLPLNITRPDFEAETSYIPLFSIILIATVILIILAKFRALRLWKLWFFVSVLLLLTVAFNAFFNEYIAIALALLLTILKVFKSNVYTHNISEFFIYGGLTAIFAPIFNIKSAIILLILISIYDAFAVWKSKHMIALAKFQSEAKVFAGIYIPYGKNAALLGGGDIGFPLLFAAAALPIYGLFRTLLIPIGATIALLLLLIKGKKNTFYPAMPFITAGCLVGYIILISLYN